MQRFCTNCGNHLNEGARFCNKCGAPMGGPQAQPPARATVVVPPPSVPETQLGMPAPETQLGMPAPVEPPANRPSAPATQIWGPEESSTQPQKPTPTAPQYPSPTPATPPPQATPPGYGASYAQPTYQQPAYQQPNYPQQNYQQPGYQQPAPSGGLQQNIAGLLCYITIIPAIVFLVLEPYNKNRFIRFHAFQCLFLAATSFVLNIALSLFVNLLPGFLAAIAGLLSLAVSLGFVVIWVFMLVKAYNNEMYKLPVIGDLAEQQAGR